MNNNIQLRVWQKDDAQQLAAIANNKNIWSNVLDSFPSPYTVMDALQWINKESTAQPVTKFAIEFQGNVVGGIGMILNDDVYRNTVELGYFVGETFWGKGIATNAIQTIVEHIQKNYSVNRVMARVYAYNKASMKALQKAGFHLEGIQEKAAIKNNLLLDVFVWVKFI
ncbi:MAG TPA: GNAT family protein [Chitinophagaceae bacterium]|jgi:ribosomal-protein-alanine N-acetyltransferase|nr:GNAT family N-acetyltransferase [Chitinophagaceae bacterium]MBP9740237.1 GNAT family N-acetyltransferase [Chitinophagaceae bacterium]HPH22441.1 GNAT family protein [Chitinophagaceae bacterium]